MKPIREAFNQLQTYKEEVADLFVFNEALVISDGLHARVGSLTASFERYLPWRTVRNENDRPLLEFELEKVVRGFFAPALLLDYLRYFVLFEMADGQVVKKVAAYHQFHAVRAAVQAVVVASTKPEGLSVREQWASYADRVSSSELAFFDALADNESAVLQMGDEALKRIAVEITEKLRASTSVDWQKRESVRARLRNLVRITLRRHRYPTGWRRVARS